MKRIKHTDPKWKFPFLEYAPEKPQENLPLIIQLHGAGERGTDLDLMDVNGFSQILQGEKDYPCRFVMPQCPADTFWAARVESVLEFIGQMIEEFKVDEKRIYLTGFSMGGYGTWYTAMAKPDLFAAIAPICGGGMSWNAGVLTMPIWAFHSEDDPAVPVVQTDEMVSRLQGLGANVTYTRYADKGHGSWVPAMQEELLNWLLNQKK